MLLTRSRAYRTAEGIAKATKRSLRSLARKLAGWADNIDLLGMAGLGCKLKLEVLYMNVGRYQMGV